MKVWELIQKLQGHDQDAEVTLAGRYGRRVVDEVVRCNDSTSKAARDENYRPRIELKSHSDD